MVLLQEYYGNKHKQVWKDTEWYGLQIRSEIYDLYIEYYLYMYASDISLKWHQILYISS